MLRPEELYRSRMPDIISENFFETIWRNYVGKDFLGTWFSKSFENTATIVLNGTLTK